MTELHVGDYGTALKLTVTESGSAIDISGVTTKQIKLRTPDGRLLTKTASFTSTGTDGQFQYTVQSGDLDAPGQWRWQGYLAGLGGWTGHTSEGDPFEVKQIVG
jgi:hypothetical protein